MSKSVVIEARNLQKIFDVGKQQIEVLKKIDFEIYSGEYVILFGPSGCGKSTILNVVSGLEPPTKGELFVRGESLYKKKQQKIAEYRRSKIGIVFQQFNLLKSLSIQENVALPMAAGGEPYRKRMDRAQHLLDMVGLKKYIKQKPMELSGGQQQRVAIARALSTNPWILICDEPTGNLDSKAADEVMEIIAGLNTKSKRTVILVTHNPEYLSYPHRVFYVRDGEITKIQVNRDIREEESGHEDDSHENVDYKAAFEAVKKKEETPSESPEREKPVPSAEPPIVHGPVEPSPTPDEPDVPRVQPEPDHSEQHKKVETSVQQEGGLESASPKELETKPELDVSSDPSDGSELAKPQEMGIGELINHYRSHQIHQNSDPVPPAEPAKEPENDHLTQGQN